MTEIIDQWKAMSFRGRHPHDLSKPEFDKVASNARLKFRDLFPEAEEFSIAIQDQVVNTINYQKRGIKDGIIQDDRCRRCKEKSETIQHITGACSHLVQPDYLF